MRAKFSLSQNEIKDNVAKVVNFLKKKKVDGLYISSTDRFLNEYVPLEDCHRYYITGFTGSTALVLLTAQGQVFLFVDGRYHEQADKEVDASVVTVVKCTTIMPLGTAFTDKMKELGIKTIAVEGERTSQAFEMDLANISKLVSFDNEELQSVIDFKPLPSPTEIKGVSLDIVGLSVKEKLEQILLEGEGIFITALDSLSWLSNARGFHLPHQSPFLGVGFALREVLHVFVTPETPVEKNLLDNPHLHFHFIKNAEMKKTLKTIKKNFDIKKVFYTPAQMSGAQYRLLDDVFGKKLLFEKKTGITEFHSLKNEKEIAHMRDCFLRSSKAVYETIKTTKQNLKDGKRVSELDLYNLINKNYEAQGALDQSFNTISAMGANSSIIHYSSSDDKFVIPQNELVLLDSGAIYAGGYSTDKTRAFFSGGQPSQKQKEIYTLVLKGLLNAQNAILPEGVLGVTVDILAREPLLLKGYDYGHGTGHGIGLNVHEGCASFSLRSPYGVKAGMTVSVEPGIYIPDFGGVRLENVVYVKKHPTMTGMICFENLVFIGFDWELIDLSYLNEQEKAWLEDYEKACLERGTSFRS